MVVMCWAWDWLLVAEPAVLLAVEELLGLGVAIVVCLDSISSAGLQCRYTQSDFTLRPSRPDGLSSAAETERSGRGAADGEAKTR